jgi:hypothetical protein
MHLVRSRSCPDAGTLWLHWWGWGLHHVLQILHVNNVQYGHSRKKKKSVCTFLTWDVFLLIETMPSFFFPWKRCRMCGKIKFIWITELLQRQLVILSPGSQLFCPLCSRTGVHIIDKRSGKSGMRNDVWQLHIAHVLCVKRFYEFNKYHQSKCLEVHMVNPKSSITRESKEKMTPCIRNRKQRRI